jgi:STAS domain
VRPERSIYFANADHIHSTIVDSVDDDGVRVLVFDGTAVPDLEYTGLEMLAVARRQSCLRDQGSERLASATARLPRRAGLRTPPSRARGGAQTVWRRRGSGPAR